MIAATTTTTPGVDVGALGDRIAHVWGYVFWAAITVLVGYIAWQVWRGKQGTDRWVIDPDGTIHGPWLAKRRVRRALMPLVHIRHPKDPTDAEAWMLLADKLRRRQERRLRRCWKDARVILGVDARLDMYSLDHDQRQLWLGTGDATIDTRRMMIRLANLRVLGAHGQLLFDVDQVNAAQVVVTIPDALPEPIEHTSQRVERYLYTITVDGEQRSEWFTSAPTDILVVTGTRWRSLIEPDVAWDLPDSPDEADAIMRSDPVPDRDPSPVTRGNDRTGPDLDLPGPTHNDPADRPRRVRLVAAQLDLIRALFMVRHTVGALASQLDRDPSNVRRSLLRMADIGLTIQDADGWWTLTDLGRQTVQLPAPDPTMEGSVTP